MKSFKYKFLSILFIFITSFAFARGASAADVFYNYAGSMGSSTADESRSIIHDTSGNIFTVGVFTDTADFDPGAGTSNLTSAGGNDMFIQKLDSNGDFVWVKQIGGTGADWADSTITDSSGNVYVTGNFAGTVDFDPGAGTSNLTSAGNGDIFILKLDTDGTFVWVKQIGGTGADYTEQINFDSSGNFYAVGGFASTVDFDPGAGTSNLTSAGNVDMFVLKLDSSFNFVWAKRFGGAGWGDWIQSVSVDSSGNVYTAGSFGGSVSATDFDPGAGTYTLTPVANTDGFVSKLDSNGDFVWAKRFGDSEWDGGYSATDSSGNTYITGNFSGTVDFDPGAGTSNLVSTGVYNTYVLKLDTNGDFVWVKHFPGVESSGASNIKLGVSNNIYVTGAFAGAVDFDPGAGTYTLTSDATGDGFVLKLDSDGTFVWAKQLEGTGNFRPNEIDVNPANEYVYTTGYFSATADFDPGTGTVNLTSAGGNDIFISVLAPDTTSPTLTNISSTPTTTEATITWTSNELSSSIVEYGLTTSYGTTTTETDTGTGVTSHSVNISGLQACNTYHYRVKSNDPSANNTTSSDSTFSTTGCTPPPTWLLQQMSDTLRNQSTPTNTQTNTNNTSNTNNTNTNTNTGTKFIFTKNLKYKMKDNQVLELQKYLNNNGYPISLTGIGSLGNETNYFGLATKSALTKYQITNKIVPASGYFGPVTRARVNK